MVHSSTSDQMSCTFRLVIASQLLVTAILKTVNTQWKWVPLQIHWLILLVQTFTMLYPVMDQRDHRKEESKAMVGLGHCQGESTSIFASNYFSKRVCVIFCTRSTWAHPMFSNFAPSSHPFILVWLFFMHMPVFGGPYVLDVASVASFLSGR